MLSAKMGHVGNLKVFIRNDVYLFKDKLTDRHIVTDSKCTHGNSSGYVKNSFQTQKLEDEHEINAFPLHGKYN